MELTKNKSPQNIEESSTIWGDFKFSFRLYKSNFKPIFIVLLIRIILVNAVGHSLQYIFRDDIYHLLPNMSPVWIEWLIRFPSTPLRRIRYRFPGRDQYRDRSGRDIPCEF